MPKVLLWPSVGPLLVYPRLAGGHPLSGLVFWQCWGWANSGSTRFRQIAGQSSTGGLALGAIHGDMFKDA